MQLLMQITKQLYEKYGGYENDHILTRQDSAKTLQEMVANCELDAAFSAYNTKNPRLAYIDFPPIELVMVLRKDHLMARFGSEHPEEYLPRLPLKQLEDIPVATLHKLTCCRTGWISTAKKTMRIRPSALKNKLAHSRDFSRE